MRDNFVSKVVLLQFLTQASMFRSAARLALVLQLFFSFHPCFSASISGEGKANFMDYMFSSNV